MIVAVTGATGVVGRFVVADQLSRGTTLRLACRVGSDRSGFPDSLNWLTGDLQDSDLQQRLLEGADALIHCAFSHVPGRYRGGEGSDVEGFWRCNLLDTVALLEAARRLGVSRVILFSSRAVFGTRRVTASGFVDDDTAVAPDTHYGALKAAQESLARVYAGTELCVTTLRPTGVYGLTHPATRSKWYRLARQALDQAGLPAERLGTEVHGGDLAAAVQLLLSAPAGEVAGRIFNCSDLLVSDRGIHARFCELAGVRQPGSECPPAVVPAENSEVVNIMRCEGLRELGWQPSGEARLQQTLTELLTAAREDSSV